MLKAVKLDRLLSLNEGDILIIPHGDPHAMRNEPFIKPVDHEEEVQRVFAQGLRGKALTGSRRKMTRERSPYAGTQTVKELEGRQLSWQGPWEHNGQTQTG